MSAPHVRIEGGDYEHTLSVSSHRNGVDVEYVPSFIPQIYKKVLGGEPIEMCEFSLSNLMMMQDRGRTDLVGVPIFPNRAFRHAALLVTRESAIANPSDLRGKRVGVVDYSMTAAVWARGLLLDEFDVSWRDMHWVSAGPPRFPAPAAVDLVRVDGDLEDMLAKGDIDALLHPHSRDAASAPADRRFRPLLQDHVAREKAYYARTGSYPINHVLIASRSLLERVPGAAQAAFEAYAQAKQAAMDRRLATTFLPWADLLWREMLDTFGDPSPYGVTDVNRRTIETLAEHLLQQKLISQPVNIEALFAPGSLSWRE